MDLFSTTQEDTNSQGWTLLMNTIEYTGSLSIVDYYLEGDVTATEEYTELCEKHLENFLEKGDADKKLLTKRIVKAFYEVPEIYNLSRFTIFNNNCHRVIFEDYDAPYSSESLKSICGSKKKCIEIFRQLNTLYSSNQISYELYENGLKGFVILYFENCINPYKDDTTETDVYELIMFLVNNDDLAGLSVLDSEYGTGQTLQSMRGALEKYCGVPINIPEGCDPDEDDFYSNYDWQQVVDSIMQGL